MLPKKFRPMKPATLERLEDLKHYNYIIQAKLDGLRCVAHEGEFYSNTLKKFPNRHLKKHFEHFHQFGRYQSITDGELIIEGGTLQDVQSLVMSKDSTEGLSKLRFYIFDCIPMAKNNNSFTFDMIYKHRLDWSWSGYMPGIVHLRWPMTEEVKTIGEVVAYEERAVKFGYEGIILRCPNSGYKFGRATEKEGTFFKFKRVEDAEGVIIEQNIGKVNLNPKELDARGLTKRGASKHRLIESDMLGSFTVKGINGRYTSKTFDVSLSSLTYRARMFLFGKNSIGKVITYTYAKHRGTEDAPAEPRMKCFREDL